jgi:hypothetical protein
MAVIIKKKVGAPVKVETSAPIVKTVVSLPSAESSPLLNLGDYSILLYGEKKIGKTSLASKFSKAFFLMFEPGAKALSVFQRHVNSWQEFKDYVKLLQKDTSFETVVVDPVDLAYKACFEYVCKKLVIDHPSDESWGKGWNAIRDEFTSEINKLLALKKGVILISHAAEKEIKTRTGDTYHKIMATMSSQAREVLEGIVDIWAYYSYEGKKRVLIIEGDDHVGAGHRLEKHFFYLDGTAIKEIPMGGSPKEAYENFVKAFNNKLAKEPAKLTLKRRE